MAELLLELFCEEIPARMQMRAAQDLQERFVASMEKARVKAEKVQTFVTPRRLALFAENLPNKQPDYEERRRGPREGAPVEALEGFLRSAGISRDTLEIEDSGKGRFYVAKLREEGRSVAEVIALLVPELVRDFPWPKSMRWGSGELRWVRPLHSILCLLDGKIVPFRLDDIQSGDITYGHRFMAPGEISVRNFADYEKKLHDAFVVLDACKRQTLILAGTQRLAESAGAALLEDAALLEEVAGLVEWPIPLMGTFDETFLKVPAEVLTSTMRSNQKYFSLRSKKDGKFLNHFIVIANLDAKDGGKAIISGNQRVLAARLSDAKFFWEQDMKVGLEARLPQLAHVVFHARLGTQAERVARLEKLAGEIAARIAETSTLPPPEKNQLVCNARQAARLAKADLVSGTVGEFPEVQGIVGGYLARHEKIDEKIALAIREHYRPAGPSDQVPSAPVSIAVALADKLDMLVGFWTIDEKPTGSKDPYALRRAALGVIRIILGNRLRLPLNDLMDAAAKAYPDTLKSHFSGVSLMEFFADRLKVHLREQGARHDLVDAVFALAGEDDLYVIIRRVEALAGFLSGEDGVNLLTGYRRATNILRIEEKKSGESYEGAIDKFSLKEIQEQTLAQAIEKTRTRADAALADEDFQSAMAALADLREPVDDFFNHVTVNAEDAGLRMNRLRLLSAIRSAVDRIADFSRIEG
jgi:glycyl-tRNA synthetase beta chain